MRSKEIIKHAVRTRKPMDAGSVADIVRTLWKEVDQMNQCIVADESHILIQCGRASIELKRDGTINIIGKEINIEGSGRVEVKASGHLVLKGSKISQN